MSGLRTSAGRGFTLLEIVLASVIGSIILLSAMMVFRAMAASDRVMQAKFESIHDAAITHGALRRSMTRLILANQDALSLTEPGGDDNVLGIGDNGGNGPPPDDRDEQNNQGGDESQTGEEQDEQGQGAAGAGDADGTVTADTLSDTDNIGRARLVLGRDWPPSLRRMVEMARIDGVELFDPSLGLGFPQRLEVVLTEPPLPPSFRAARPSWLPARTREVLDGYAAFDNAAAMREGGVRGAFELRPDGARELVLAGLGVNSRTLLRAESVEIPREARNPAGWTLWWRPITNREFVLREAGRLFDPDANPDSLEGAIPLLRGITVARWNIIADRRVPDSDRRVLHRYDEYRALSERDVPGYVEFELETADGMYHSWAFEVGWVVDDAFEPDDSVIGSVARAFEAAGEPLPATDTDGDGIPDGQGTSVADGGSGGSGGGPRGNGSGPGSGVETGLRSRGSSRESRGDN